MTSNLIRLLPVEIGVHGAPCRFTDPARFSLAHGGKDRHPYPVPVKVYDKTIEVLKSAVARAKLGNVEKFEALRRLDEEARRLELSVAGPSLPEFVAEEMRRSHEYAGRSVFGWDPAPTGNSDWPAAGQQNKAAQN